MQLNNNNEEFNFISRRKKTDLLNCFENLPNLQSQ